MGFRRFPYQALSLALLNIFLFGGAVTLAFPVASRAQAKPADPPKEHPDVKLGRETHEEMLRSGLRLMKDPKQQERIESIGRKMAAIANAKVIPATYGSPNTVPFDYKFFIVEDKDINAFCLPGGFIYVNSGLLKYVQSDDELAGVLGHEIMHAAHSHVNRLMKEQNRLNNQMLLGILAAIIAKVPAETTSNLMTGFQLFALQRVNGHSQNAERDADSGGIELVVSAGYNPVGSLTFMERLARDEAARPEMELGVYRTHPPSKERAQAMVDNIARRGLPINRRSVTNALKVTTRTAPASANSQFHELLLDDKLVYRSASADKVRDAAESLDRILDGSVQIYDVKSESGSVTVRGQSLLAFDTADALLLGPQFTPNTAGDQACKTLRNALYRQMLDRTAAGMVTPPKPVNDR